MYFSLPSRRVAWAGLCPTGPSVSYPKRRRLVDHTSVHTLNESVELELACLQALQNNDYLTAFRFADRRCRVQPRAQSHHHVLRADALYLLGHADLAMAALRRALELDPGDQQANRRVARWASGTMQVAAAERLLGSRADWVVHADAIACLKAAGRTEVVKLDVLFDRIRGWIAWSTDDVVDIAIEGFARQSLASQPDHPLAKKAFPHVASLDIPRRATSRDLELRLSIGGRRFYEKRWPAEHGDEPAAPDALFDPAGVIPNPVLTVIVPIHGDVDATRACLASLKAELEASPGCCAVLVDDASPDPRMQRLLEEFAGDPAIKVRRNAANLGFARAVNRGLLDAPSGDVILLNADTVLPPQCLRRFIACAQSSADIATITPLSNNGEFTSFPIANRFNPFPDPVAFLRIDAAARSNAGLAVDLPSGTGFCLYVTRRCLDAIGPLSERYGQGYYEDVDYCLRASERGLRNICAPSIYVGHLGSRSFGATKRALVVNNLKLLNGRFPAHENECAAFVVADPLKEARARIERALVAGASYDRCLVAPDSWREVVRARAGWLIARGHSVLLVEVARAGRASLIDLSGASPQNLEMSFAASSGAGAALPVLRAMTYRRLEVFAPSGLPDRAIRFIASQPAPVDMIFEQNASMPSGPEQQPDKPKSSRARRVDLARLAARVEDHVAICPESNRYARLAAPTRPLRYEPLHPSRRKRGGTGPAAVACGIVCDRSTVAHHRLVLALARKLAPGRKAELVHFGASLNDPELMATGRVFSTGAVDDSDLPDLIKCHDIGRIFVLDRQSLFGSYRLHVAKETGLPLAYFRWPHSMRRRRGDLALDPRLTDAAVVDAVTGWLQPERGSS